MENFEQMMVDLQEPIKLMVLLNAKIENAEKGLKNFGLSMNVETGETTVIGDVGNDLLCELLRDKTKLFYRIMEIMKIGTTRMYSSAPKPYEI